MPRKRKADSSTATAAALAGGAPPKRGIAFDILSHLFAPMGVPVLAGLSPDAVASMPPNTLFAAVVDQHWILGLVGTRFTLIFDPLGLPVGALQHMMPGVSFLPWNRYGYQAMFSSVCGYYLAAAAKEIQHGSLLHTADIDKALSAILPYRVERTETMPEWYQLHRHYNSQLSINDKLIVEYVNHTYPNLGYMNAHEARFQPGQSAVVGSPLYHHAGINAQDAHARFKWVNRLARTADPQRGWPGLGEAIIDDMPNPLPPHDGLRLVNPAERGHVRGARGLLDEELVVRERGPVGYRERIQDERGALNAYNAPTGRNADPRNPGAGRDTTPENIAGPPPPPPGPPPPPPGPPPPVPPQGASRGELMSAIAHAIQVGIKLRPTERGRALAAGNTLGSNAGPSKPVGAKAELNAELLARTHNPNDPLGLLALRRGLAPSESELSDTETITPSEFE